MNQAIEIPAKPAKTTARGTLRDCPKVIKVSPVVGVLIIETNKPVIDQMIAAKGHFNRLNFS